MIINKVTSLYSQAGARITDEDVQAHIDEHNSSGWSLITVTDQLGWYRFFWEKTVE